MQLIKDIRWSLQKAKMRAYLRRKHGGNVYNIYGGKKWTA